MVPLYFERSILNRTARAEIRLQSPQEYLPVFLLHLQASDNSHDLPPSALAVKPDRYLLLRGRQTRPGDLFGGLLFSRDRSFR